MRGQNRVALFRRELVEVLAEHVVLDAECDQPDFWLLVAWDLRRRVQRDRLPDGPDLLLGQAMSFEERASGVRSVDLETLVLGTVTLDEAYVMEHGADVEELG